MPSYAGSAQAAASGTTGVAGFTLTDAAVLKWVWEQVESVEVRRALVDPDDVPVGQNGESAIAITPNADGTLTLTVTVGNAVKGYWYAIVSDTDLGGNFDTVVSYKFADADGVLDLDELVVNPQDERRFYKVRICEEDPDGE